MSKLFDAARAFAAAHPTRPPTRTSGTWDQLCGVLMYQFGAALGWYDVPEVVGPTAAAVGNASGWLNPRAADAPIGALHFWTIGSAGHVGMDLNGGGTSVFMATKALASSWGSAIGVQSVAGYSAAKGATYRGWSTNYGGGRFNIPAEPAPVPADPTIRTTIGIGANVRTEPQLADANKLMPLKGNIAVKILGWREGALANGSTKWFVHAAGVSHSSGFTDPGTHDLPDLTPPPVVVPPVVVEPEPPVVEPTPDPEPEPPVVEPTPDPEPPVVVPEPEPTPDPDPPVEEPAPVDPDPKPDQPAGIQWWAVIVGIVAAAAAVWAWLTGGG